MKDEISNNQFWERYLDITDGEMKESLKDFALSRKNQIKHIGFDYRLNVFNKSISNLLLGEQKRSILIGFLEVLVDYLIDSVKNIKKHHNFAISKKWRDFN
jgi:hypothetical protein